MDKCSSAETPSRQAFPKYSPAGRESPRGAGIAGRTYFPEASFTQRTASP